MVALNVVTNQGTTSHIFRVMQKREMNIFALHILKIPGKGRGWFGDVKRRPDGS